MHHACVVLPLQVYGNLDDNSGTGVCFTRNPATGEKGLYGEYLANAQGEDVVAGGRACVRSSLCACAYAFLTAAVSLKTGVLYGLQTTIPTFPPPLTKHTLGSRPTSPCTYTRLAAGIRTPLNVTKMAEVFPTAYVDLVRDTTALEQHMQDMQDCE